MARLTRRTPNERKRYTWDDLYALCDALAARVRDQDDPDDPDEDAELAELDAQFMAIAARLNKLERTFQRGKES